MLTEVDACYYPDTSGDEEDGVRPRETKKKGMRPMPEGEFVEIPLRDDPAKMVKIGTDLPPSVLESLVNCLRRNADLFAWSASEMPGIPLELACHHLAANPDVKCVAQRHRAQNEEKAKTTAKAVADVLAVGFIKEVKYTTWLSNVVLVKKSNGKWRKCVDFTDFNRACPKDAFPVPSIDKPVDNASGYRLVSFLDAYSGYNEIAMNPPDQEKTAFMTSQGNYCYRVMPFGLKNAEATYQRMMNKVFKDQIGRVVDVYLNDMIVKSKTGEDHLANLQEVFVEARRNNLRFNLEKCTFGV